jgi:hypothetical protein
MNLSSTSWMHQADDSYMTTDLRDPEESQGSTSRYPCAPTHRIATAAAPPAPPPREIHKRGLAVLHSTAAHETSLRGRGHLIRGRTRGDVFVDLQRICGEANAQVLHRMLLRWGLYAVRHVALRQLQRDTALLLWARLGGRCFAWWLLVTERRLCREALYEAAVQREAAFLRDGVCRVAWATWQRWARARVRRRDRATRLSLINRQRHALLRLDVWLCYPRQCRILTCLQSIRFRAERRLARFALVRWRLHTLTCLLLLPMEVKAAQRVALAVFCAWRRRAAVAAQLHRLQQEASWTLCVDVFGRWKQWLRRRLQAALLQKANERRHLLSVFTEWAWQQQLKALSFSL